MAEWKAAEVMKGLIHHGIKGQKWGKRNGPPYPLKAEVKEKAYGDKKSSGGNGKGKGSSDSGEDRAGVLTPDTVAAITIVGTSLLVDGAFKLIKNKIRARMIAKTTIKMQEKRKAELEAEEENQVIDEKTGLPLKEDHGFDPGAQQDALSINPSIDITGTPSTPNCTMCTAAMEMRRRGYDVSAGQTNENDAASGGVKESEYRSWFGKSNQSNTKYLDGTQGSKEDYTKKVKSEMSKGGDGARGEIVVKWADNTKHSMFYEIEKGEPVIYDTQFGWVYRGDEANKILEASNSSSVRRLDNLQANVDKMKASGALSW